jgi:hypothetical protein
MEYSDYVAFLVGKVLDKALNIMARTVTAQAWEYHADFCHSIFIRWSVRVSPVNRDLPAIRHLDDVSFIRDLKFTVLGEVDVPQLLERPMRKKVKSWHISSNVPITLPHDLFVLFCLLINEFGLRPIMGLDIGIGCGTND